ncbi:MAG: CDP-alcohol phosphatidyltransferase family protein [Acidimicrobiales bacterium]
MSTREPVDRVLTVPNLITLVRLCMIPVFVWLLFGRENPTGAAVLLGVLGATDWVDGFIARRFNQVSTVGKVFDPIADRLLLFTAVICILIEGAVPAVIAWPVIAREVLVSVAVAALAAMGARRIDVTWFGKAGTFALMCAFPLFLAASDDDFPLHDAALVGAWIFAVAGLILSYYALIQYVPLARRALAEGRQGKATPASG